MSIETLPSVCPHDCPSACSLEVDKPAPDRIGRIHGAKANSYTAGVICAKVARYAERIHHPDRITRPMRRAGPRGSGEFEIISWETALDEVVGKFKTITDEFGAEAIWPYYYAGTMGQIQRDGINRLRHAMGYSRQQTTICTSIAYQGWTAGVGVLRGSDPREMAESDLIVVWGGNPVSTQVNAMTHIQQARKQRSAKLVVIDPYRTPTAAKADLHLMLRPGTDGALACAVMHVLFERDLVDRNYMRRYTNDADVLERHLKSKTPQWAEVITGLSAEAIEEFALLYGSTQRSFIRLGIGFTRSHNGAHNTHAISCLPAITGAWQHRGGGALLSTTDIFKLDKTLIEGLDCTGVDQTRILDMSRIGPILNGDPEDLGDGPSVKALLVQNSNPMVVAPDSNLVRRGFERDDLFVCVHEQFMTETARMADIVLPATMFLEHEDIYQSYGQVHLQLARPVLNPPGECRSNHELIGELGCRLGSTHAAFGMTIEELVEQTLQRSGYPTRDEMIEAKWLDCAASFEEMHFLTGFGWPDGRFRFKPDWAALGPLGDAMPDLPDHWAVIEEATKEFPFRLITPPARNFLNTTFNQTTGSVDQEGEPRVKIHTADALEHGIQNQMLVQVGNERGQIELKAELTEGIGRGVAAIEGIWQPSAFAGGMGVNALTGTRRVAPVGGAAFHDNHVWIRDATSA